MIALERASWPAAQLGDALAALVRRLGLGTQRAEPLLPAASSELPDWIEWAARRLGCEAQPAEMSYADMLQELLAASPALLQVEPDAFLLLLGSRGSKLHLLTPSGATGWLHVRHVVAAIRQPLKQELRAPWDSLLDEAQIPASKRERVIDQLLSEPLAAKRFDRCWRLRGQYGAETSQSLFRLLREAGALPSALAFVLGKTISYLLWLASWALLGWLSFNGHMDRGWLTGWALLLLTSIPFQAAVTWWQGSFAIKLGGFLKQRLLTGALRLRPEEMRHWGIGMFLGQALEAAAVETLAVNGGLAGLLGIVELAASSFLLGKFALVLATWCLLTAVVAWRFRRRWETCTASRLEMTQELIENMVGHRTRLAQQQPAEWHAREAAALDQYLERSHRLDFTGTWLVAALPRGWLIAGLACLVPAFLARQEFSSETAVVLGGVLLAYSAFRKLTGSFASIAVGAVAWKRIRPLFDAAARTEAVGALPTLPQAAAGQKVMEADGLTFRYRTSGSPAMEGISLAVRKGERILLEGPSGGGKTTFASLLSGLLQPEAGLLLVNGLDRHTLGESGWRRGVSAAPQFHENHILTETLLFNLLMGRRWPPTAADARQAEDLCRDLGLGDLLDRMPAGVRQMVGEGGWQLSHGEKSRVFIARALLQDSELVILDESFAALDPENLRTAMECTLQRAGTLLVIAHP